LSIVETAASGGVERQKQERIFSQIAKSKKASAQVSKAGEGYRLPMAPLLMTAVCVQPI